MEPEEKELQRDEELSHNLMIFINKFDQVKKVWQPGVVFTERELRLIVNSEVYARNDPAGLPGHNLMVIIDKFDQLVGMMAGCLTQEELDKCVAIFEDDNEEESTQ